MAFDRKMTVLAAVAAAALLAGCAGISVGQGASALSGGGFNALAEAAIAIGRGGGRLCMLQCICQSQPYGLGRLIHNVAILHALCEQRVHSGVDPLDVLDIHCGRELLRGRGCAFGQVCGHGRFCGEAERAKPERSARRLERSTGWKVPPESPIAGR